jgi:hypothetical protein
MLVIDGYVIDVEVSATPTFENEATSYAVENGVKFTDHVKTNPTGLDVEGIVSDTPVNDFVATQREIDGVLIDPDTGQLGGEGPTRDAYTRLLEIHGRKEPVTVTCALGTFESMVMLTFSPKREGGSIRFSATFQFLRIIENERTIVHVAVPRAAGKDTIKKAATFLTSDRNNLQMIRREVVQSGELKGTSVYYYEEGHPKAGQRVPDSVITKTAHSADAVAIKYVNGQAVPVDAKDYQPYVPRKERPFWPDEDHVQIPGAPLKSNLPNLPGLGR